MFDNCFIWAYSQRKERHYRALFMVIILPEVQDFVEKLEKSSMNKVIRLIQLLERFGHNLGMPHAKAISQNLFELRIRGKQEIRIMYTFRGGNVLLFYVFLKKSQQIPQNILNAIHAKLKRLPLDCL